MSNEMAKILNHPRVYAFLHVPVQSASDSVLMDMKREYCIDDFRRVVDFLKERYFLVFQTIAKNVLFCLFFFLQKKQRTKKLSELFHSYNPYDHKVGERQFVLVTEESFDTQYYVSHNTFYEQVLVPKRAEFKGKMIEVEIYEAGKHFMKGRPVEDSEPFTPSIAAPLRKGEVSGLMRVSTSIHTQICTFKILLFPKYLL
uniref:CDK5 regulatory subunit associated protein 1 like 1 n=1 Tax=Fundulus heteroclitus TaxID=8078 RepID=A0A3Q2NUS5_FUNHE